VPSGPEIVLALKIAVAAVTLLLFCSLAALLRGNYRLHGRLNVIFFTLTLVALFGLEILAHVVSPSPLESYLSHEETLRALRIHLGFSIPAAIIMPAMLSTGLKHCRRLHLSLATLFGVLWTGTFITGIFFLPYHVP
jgi:hypothetical protein